MKRFPVLPHLRTAYKEWEVLGRALRKGDQCLLFRKGGIAEGRKGFAFQHEHFWFYPTWFHAQEEGIREECMASLADEVFYQQLQKEAARKEEGALPDSIEVSLFLQVEGTWLISDWDLIKQLSDYHVCSEQMLKARFLDQNEEVLHVALVRAASFTEGGKKVLYHRSYGGCRSWIEFREDTIDWMDGLEWVQSEDSWKKKKKGVEALLGKT